MAREPRVLIYIGIKNAVLALDDQTGVEMWRTPLRGADFVSVLWDGQALLAANSGEIWRLDLPFVSKTAILVLGPPRDPAYCAGGAHADEPRCAPTWRAWAERVEGER